MRKSLFRNICSLLAILLFPSHVFAFPNDEKATLSLLSSQPTSFVLEGDRFLYAASGSSIFRIDTQTFALATEQITLTDDSDDDEANLSGDIKGLAIRSSSLFATQSDGDLLIIDLNSVTATPTAFHLTDGELGAVAADPDSADDQLYILDKVNNAVLVFDLSNETATSIALADGVGAPVTPTAIVFAPLDGSGDKVFVTSERGLVFVINEGGSGVAATITLSSANKSLNAVSVTPDGNFVLVANATDTTVHVLSVAGASEVDTDPATSGTNPIALTENSSLAGLTATNVTNPSDAYAYVSGTSGLSVIDLNITGTTFNQPAVIDFNDGGSSDTDDEPLALSSTPGLLLASSSSDGYVYAALSNAAISVVTEKPFVSISATSLGSNSLTTTSTVNLTFRSDEIGSYRVLVGGDSSANGTELTSGTVDTADTDVTTADIAYDASRFQEGTNRLFVFVTATSDGLVGRDAIDITVDTPPTGVTIVDTGFGDEKVFVTFTRLTANDIDHYNIYVDTDAANISNTALTAVGTVAQTTSGDTLQAKVVGLVNGVTYFIGVEGVDAAGNIGPRTTTLEDGTAAQATAEETVGLAGVTGETGCGLVDGRESMVDGGGVWFLVFGSLVLVWTRKRRWILSFLLLSTITYQPSTLGAAEYSPQWWSLEFKGGAWIPTNGTTRDFLGTFSPMGKVEFGFLYKSKFGAEVGVGFIGAGGKAVGTTSGAVSEDSFSFIMIPIENSFTFRADFKEEQLLVPYVKAGPDYVFFRENRQGTVTKGMKFGLHGALGLQVLLDGIEGLSTTMERSLGVNDVYFIVEGRYGWINNFGGRGVSLSGLTVSGGFLFEF